jgi:hypothetical protein
MGAVHKDRIKQEVIYNNINRVSGPNSPNNSKDQINMMKRQVMYSGTMGKIKKNFKQHMLSFSNINRVKLNIESIGSKDLKSPSLKFNLSKAANTIDVHDKSNSYSQ